MLLTSSVLSKSENLESNLKNLKFASFKFGFMLAPLDNETIFKKAFTDKVVFQQFVKDLFDVDIVVDKIETEKRFEPPLSPINFELDIYAESTDHSFVIEIQKINYDKNFDLFYASMKEPVNYRLNLNNKGIAKAIGLIDYDQLDPFVLQKMKENEMRKEMAFSIQQEGMQEGRLAAKLEDTMNGIKAGFSNEVISAITKLTDEEINKLRNQPEQ